MFNLLPTLIGDVPEGQLTLAQLRAERGGCTSTIGVLRDFDQCGQQVSAAPFCFSKTT